MTFAGSGFPCFLIVLTGVILVDSGASCKPSGDPKPLEGCLFQVVVSEVRGWGWLAPGILLKQLWEASGSEVWEVRCSENWRSEGDLVFNKYDLPLSISKVPPGSRHGEVRLAA